MRCVKEDHTAINMTLHYLDNGTVMLNFIYQKELFFLPLGFALKVGTSWNGSQKYMLYCNIFCLRLELPHARVLASRLWWTSQTSRSTRSWSRAEKRTPSTRNVWLKCYVWSWRRAASHGARCWTSWESASGWKWTFQSGTQTSSVPESC